MEVLIKKTTREEQKLASDSISRLNNYTKLITKKKNSGIKIKIEEKGSFVTIPKKAIDFLMTILSNMAEGKSISIIPSESEISTQQAANMLNVSRPHIVKLLESGVIPFSKVGSHRRVLLTDVIHYDKELKVYRRKKLDFLTNQAQELNLGYE